MPSKFLQVLERFNNEFNVERFNARGDGETDDTLALQEAYSEARAFAETYEQGAVISYPPGHYLISDTLSTLADGITIKAPGAGGDTGTSPTMLLASPDMADESYMMVFDMPEGVDRPVSGPRVSGLRLGKLEALTNTIHGIYWRAYKGIMEDVRIQQLSGHGIVLEGYDASFQALQNQFGNLDIDRCDGDGLHVIEDFVDSNFYHCNIHGNTNGYIGGCTGNSFIDCHFWGNDVNVNINKASVLMQFVGCRFRESAQHNVILDCTNGTITGFVFGDCIFRGADNLSANNTYDNFIIKRDSVLRNSCNTSCFSAIVIGSCCLSVSGASISVVRSGTAARSGMPARSAGAMSI